MDIQVIELKHHKLGVVRAIRVGEKHWLRFSDVMEVLDACHFMGAVRKSLSNNELKKIHVSQAIGTCNFVTVAGVRKTLAMVNCKDGELFLQWMMEEGMDDTKTVIVDKKPSRGEKIVESSEEQCSLQPDEYGIIRFETDFGNVRAFEEDGELFILLADACSICKLGHRSDYAPLLPDVCKQEHPVKDELGRKCIETFITLQGLRDSLDNGPVSSNGDALLQWLEDKNAELEGQATEVTTVEDDEVDMKDVQSGGYAPVRSIADSQDKGSSDILSFNSGLFGQLRVVKVDGNPMFCLADVCKALGLQNPSKVKNRLNQKGMQLVDLQPLNSWDGVSISNLQNNVIGNALTTFINEPNLYRCAFQSRKADAERFQDWVCEEVLPSICKHEQVAEAGMKQTSRTGGISKIFNYNGAEITFRSDNGPMFVNATQMAKPFGSSKRAKNWLALNSTKEFLSALSKGRKMPLADLVIVKKGGDAPGTWMHEDVAIEFARWLSPSFGVWCNDRVKELLTTGVATISNDDDAILHAMQVLQKRVEESKRRAELAERHVLRLEASNESRRLQIESQAPKVTFADAIVASESSCSVSTLAKMLKQNGVKTGGVRLFDWLRTNKYLCRTSAHWNEPTQRSMEEGLFEMHKSYYERRGEMRTQLTPMVTTKGQQYFINLFLREK
jgi:prophage antirepressor-like protein/phage antirepressor YoqD-like protein